MNRNRHEYVLDVSKNAAEAPRGTAVDGIRVRALDQSDRTGLAALMLDAFRGTIDYEGENLEDSQQEVDRYFSVDPFLASSNVAFLGDQLVSACLTGAGPRPALPLVWYVITAASMKRRGLGELLLSASLRRLHAEGYREVCAVITEGNLPSESLFSRLGFQRLEIP